MEHPPKFYTSLFIEGLDKNNKSMFVLMLLQPDKSEAIGKLGAFLKQHRYFCLSKSMWSWCWVRKIKEWTQKKGIQNCRSLPEVQRLYWQFTQEPNLDVNDARLDWDYIKRQFIPMTTTHQSKVEDPPRCHSCPPRPGWKAASPPWRL